MSEQPPIPDGSPTQPDVGRPHDSLFNDPERTGLPPAPPPGYAPPAPEPSYPPQPEPQPAPGGWSSPPPGQAAWQQPAPPTAWPQQPAAPSVPQYGQQPASAPSGPEFVKPGAALGAPAMPTYAPPTYAQPGQLPPASPPPAGDSLISRLPWGWWVGPLAVVSSLFVMIGATIVVIGVAVALGVTENFETATDDLGQVLTLLQQVLWIGVAIMIPYFVVRWLRAEHLGLTRGPNLGRAIGIGAGCLVAFYLLAAVYSLALGLDENSNELLQDTGFGDSVAKDALLAAVFTIGAPVSEEFLFRALLFGSLAAAFQRRMGVKGVYLAAVIAGVLFGSIHAGQGQDKYLPMLMALGILLCLAYYWSGTLYVPIAIHAINNSVATGVNAEPSSDWIYAIIVLATPISVLLAIGIGRFVRRTFRSEPPSRPPAGAPPVTFAEPGRPANL